MAAHYDQGDYDVKFSSQQFGQTEGSEPKPFFALTFQPMARIDIETGDRNDVNGPVRTMRLFLSQKAAPHTIRKLRELGWEGSSFNDLNPNNNEHHSFVGQIAIVRCQHEEYKGEPQEKWDFPHEGGLNIKAIDDKGMRQLDALLGKQLKETAKPKSSAPKQTAAAAASTSGNGSKVPF